MALVSVHALFPTVLAGFLTGCAQKAQDGYTPVFFTKDEYDTVTELIDVILPATRSPSASQANVQVFLDQVFSQCMTREQQDLVKDGLKRFSPGFAAAQNKDDYVAAIDKKAYDGDDNSAYFKSIKQYAMIGFFTSRQGETVASNYVKIPDGYKGEIPLSANTLNYGKTFLEY